MHRRIVVLSTLAVSLVPATASADHRPGHAPPGGGGGGGGTPTTVSALDAKPNPLVFGSSTVLSGRLEGGSAGGTVVRLEGDDVRPYGDAYTPVLSATGAPVTATSESNGRFAFTLAPVRNTQYRVVAQSSPPVTSAPRLVLVRPRVGLIVADTTPRRGARVRFRGTVAPEHDGAIALIQRRSSTGRFVTVARATLRDTGTASSTYSRRVRIRRDGAYRVKVRADDDHANGFSRTVSVDAH